MSLKSRVLVRLEARNAAYRLARVRKEALMVEFAVPGERWEVEFLVSGEVEAEGFRSDGGMGDQKALEDLLSELDAWDK